MQTIESEKPENHCTNSQRIKQHVDMNPLHHLTNYHHQHPLRNHSCDPNICGLGIFDYQALFNRKSKYQRVNRRHAQSEQDSTYIAGQRIKSSEDEK